MTKAARGWRAAWPVLGPLVPVMIAWFAAPYFGLIVEREIILMFINLVIVVGTYSFIGNSGVLSFGHISFMAIGAYVGAWITIPPVMKSNLFELPGFISGLEIAPLPGALIAGLAAAAFGAAIAIPLMRLSGISAALAMFAVLLVVHVVAANWEEVTRGRLTVFGVPTATTADVAFLWVVVAVLITYLYQSSASGMRLRASREDEIAASVMGIDVIRERRIAFTLSAFLVGIGGFLYAQFLGSFTPDAFYLSATFITLAMLVIGGIRSLAGAILGTVVVSVVAELLRRVEQGADLGLVSIPERPGLRELGLAIALLIILLVRPSGITGGHEFKWPPRRRLAARETD